MRPLLRLTDAGHRLWIATDVDVTITGEIFDAVAVLSGNDPLFAEFLKAGEASCVIPELVRLHADAASILAWRKNQNGKRVPVRAL